MNTKLIVYRLTALFAVLFFTQCGEDQETEHIKVADDDLWTVISKGLTIDSIEGDYVFTEGPVWNDAGYFLFSDIPDNKIYKYTTGAGVEVFTDSSFNSNGLAYAPNGDLLACEHGARSISQYDNNKNRTQLVAQYGEKRLNSPNDLAVHSSGAVYFTDPPWGLEALDDDPAKELAFNGLYLLKDSSLLLQDNSMFRPNGLALSPDEKYLYVGETQKSEKPKKLWYRYEISDSLRLTNRMIFAEAPNSEIEGSPDGMKTDKDGNLFCTGPGGILIFNDEGKYLGLITLPKLPSNCAFGGKNNELLMVIPQETKYISSAI